MDCPRVVYEAVPEAQCVMHLLTVTGTAVPAQKSGLLPLNQFGITFHGQIAYHDYDGSGFRPEERTKFVTNLGDKRMMFLRNHGTLTHGRSVAEAFILMHNLDRGCEIQMQRNRAAESWCCRQTMLSKERCRSRRGCATNISPKSVSTRLFTSSTVSILLIATKRISRGSSMTINVG